MKRAIFLITALLMWALIIFNYYAFSYPQPFHIVNLVKLVEWRPILLLYLALLLFAFTFTVIISQRRSLIKIFLQTVSVLQCIAALLFLVLGLRGIHNTNQQYGAIIEETKKRAASDIKRDSVIFISHGFPILDPNDLKKDSIRARYGIYTTFYCTMGQLAQKEEEYYEQLTADYLDKRNGRNWTERMQRELMICP